MWQKAFVHPLSFASHHFSPTLPTMTDTLVSKNTMFAKNTLVANNTVAVNCAIPHAFGGVFSSKIFVKPFCNSFWACTLTNRAPQLEIKLVWTCAVDFYVQPLGLQSFRVVTRDGTIVSSVPVPAVDHLTTLNGNGAFNYSFSFFFFAVVLTGGTTI